VGPFTLDFYCAELRLAVELDGAHHFEERVRRYDEGRDAALRADGIRTLRFSSLDVLKEADGVPR